MTQAGGEMDVEGEGEGEEATPRRIFSSFIPSSQRPPNFRKQFLTPQTIRTEMETEDSQIQPSELQRSPFGEKLEDETESTASSPQLPLPRGKSHSSLPEISRPEPQVRLKPPTVTNGATDRVMPPSSEHRPANNTSPKTSPMRVHKPVRTKRRSARTTSDVWDYFAQEDTENGSIATCIFW